jgi:hypothetical protein
MEDSVYVLSFVREWPGGNDTELMIGVYKNEPDARAAIARLKFQPGFVDYPEGFIVDRYELGKDHWTEGFVRE